MLPHLHQQDNNLHPSGLAVPATVGRQGYMYGSQNLGLSGGRRDAGFLRQSIAPSQNQQQAYAPPRYCLLAYQHQSDLSSKVYADHQ